MKKFLFLFFLIPNLTLSLTFKDGKQVDESQINNTEIISDDKIKDHILKKSIFAVSKSGTISLEISKRKIPSIIIYKMNFINFLIVKMLVKIKYANILNIAAGQMIIPELLQSKCNPKEIYKLVDYVFTSGGIGPTHDDITTPAIAKAFDVSVERNKEALRRLQEHYKGTNIELNSARLKMADIPKGATLIDNPVSAAPGFNIQNVYVMAGVPKIMQAMLDGILKNIKFGKKTFSISIACEIGEGNLAKGIGEIEETESDLEIGCYPWFKSGVIGTNIVVRSINEDMCNRAAEKVKKLIKDFGKTHTIIK